MYATHNSATGYSVRWPWWAHGPVNWWSQCQSSTLEEQWDAGTRFFDFRVRQSHDGDCLTVCHGIPEYSMSYEDALDIIHAKQVESELGELEPVYIMTLYDYTFRGDDDRDYVTEQYEYFRDLYASLRFLNLYDKKTGEVIVAGNATYPSTYEMHASVDGWKVVLPPRLWAWLYNCGVKEEYANYIESDERYLMLDFL